MRTQIVCTIGPNTESDEKIKELIENGMSVARLNFSHDVHEAHGMRIDRVRKWAKKLKKDVKILCDLQGPKIRTAPFENAPITLKDGEKVIFTTSSCKKIGPAEIVINDPYLHQDLKKDDIILIDDGQIELFVERVSNHKIFVKVIRGGDLYPKKGINVPLTHMTTASLTDKDKIDLKFILTKNPEWIALSFVQSAQDVLDLRKLIGKSDAKIMCKIERAMAIKNLDEIVEQADGVMVARGDLGAEMPIERLPIIQKQIIKRANFAGKPVITATHMLASMIHNPFPTRAEVSDIANAIFDGTDAIMLSNETTVGDYPIEALTIMRKVAAETEKYLFRDENL